MKPGRVIGSFISLVILAGFCISETFRMPVAGATSADYNHASFWYHPWGASGVHKGVDIFAGKGTAIHPATGGIVLYTGQFKMGGNVVGILGPKWRVHYYAHLDEVKTRNISVVGPDDIIGTVGTSGNAAGKPSHLHYSIITLFPYFWKADDAPQGYRKMFYLDPVAKLLELEEVKP